MLSLSLISCFSVVRYLEVRLWMYKADTVLLTFSKDGEFHSTFYLAWGLFQFPMRGGGLKIVLKSKKVPHSINSELNGDIGGGGGVQICVPHERKCWIGSRYGSNEESASHFYSFSVLIRKSAN